MIPIQIMPTFQARWEAPLKPSSSCFKQKLAQILFFPIAAIVRRILLPAAWMTENNRRLAHSHFKKFANRLQQDRQIDCSQTFITTPDDARIQVFLFRTLPLEPNRSTIVCFNPNATIAEQLPFRDFLFEAVYREIPCNFVFFNYRNADKFSSINDLVIDGASVVQWVKEALRTPNDQIHFIGRSLGGIVGTKVKALNPIATSGRFVNDRSGSSMDDFIDSIPLAKLKVFEVFKTIVRWIGLSFDAAHAFRALVGRKLVVHHPQDRVFPPSRNLEHRIQDVEHEAVELVSDASMESDPHNSSLEEFTDRATQRRAAERVYDFLFNPA